MSNRRCSGFFLVYGFLLLVSTASLHAEPFARGMLWEIAGAGPTPSYLLGTIHSDDPSVTAVPQKVATTFAAAKSFTAELDMNLSAMLSAQQAMLFVDGRNLQSVVGESRFRRAVATMAGYGLPEADVKQMKPWAVAVQLSLPKPQSGVFLDLLLYQRAQEKGIPTYGLETVQEQLQVFDDMPMAQQIVMLDEALANYSEMPAMIDRLVQLYLQRDLAGLHRYNTQLMQVSDRALAEYIGRELIIERNRRMVERMQPRLREGSAFIAVGALHLPGEHGILNLLQARGYRLRALY